MISKKIKSFLPLLALLPLAALVPPAVVYFEPREIIPVTDPKFAAVSDVLQSKCSDCHTPNKTVYPFYFNLPGAHEVISQDIAMAQNAMVITSDQLSGKEAFNPVQVAKIGAQIASDNMPPLRYKALHWRALFSPAEKEMMLAWVKDNSQTTALQPIPETDPFKLDPQRVALGEKLFNEKRLSADNTVSCASCHGLDKGGGDKMVNAVGIHGQHGPINSPTVFNSAFNFCQFWDGRARDLQDQANGPVNNPKEMGSNWPEATAKLKQNKTYVADFKKVYGEEINSTNVTDAIASYEKTLLTPNSRFDKFLRGDKTALTADEQHGYDLFLKNNCATCHAGVNLGGMSFERLGIYDDYFAKRGTPTDADNGRISVTKLATDLHRFKVPSLRNIEAHDPYFHDGSTTDLKKAVQIMGHYQNGHDLNDKDADSIVAFLKTLTGEYEGKPVSALSPSNVESADDTKQPMGSTITRPAK